MYRIASGFFSLILVFSFLVVGCGPGPTRPGTEVTGNPTAERVAWLRVNSSAFSSITPTDEDWTDLAPIGEAIGTARVVLLGEQTHGDGATFMAKARLIRYLHQELGFDLLAFESGIFDVDKANRLISDGSSAHDAMRESVFRIWTGSDQFQDVMDYVDETRASGVPLQIAGFDSQFTGAASVDHLVDDLEMFLTEIEAPTPLRDDWSSGMLLFQGLIEGEWVTPDGRPSTEEHLRLIELLAEALGDVNDQRVSHQDQEFWTQVLESSLSQSIIDYSTEPGQRPPSSVQNLRDIQMGENLVWLASAFPDKKIIAWLATFHAVRDIQSVSVPDNPGLYDGGQTAGGVTWRSLGQSSYTIGFIAAEGAFGRWWSSPTNLPEPDAGSLEDLMYRTGSKFRFLNLRDRPAGGEWLDTYNVAGPLGYAPMRARWPAHLDGLVYTRTMTPSTGPAR